MSLNKVPSTILREVIPSRLSELGSIEPLLWVCEGLKKERKLYKFEWGHTNLPNDTLRMATQLEMPFNAKWSYNKMEEKHTEYMRAVMVQKYSPEPFKELDKRFDIRCGV